MRKETHRVLVTSEQIDSAIARTRQFEVNDPRVSRVRYEPKEDLVSLYFADGFRVHESICKVSNARIERSSRISKSWAMGQASTGPCSMSTITFSACLSVDLGRNDG